MTSNENSISPTDQRSIFHPNEFHALEMFEQKTARIRERQVAQTDDQETNRPSLRRKAVVLVAAGLLAVGAVRLVGDALDHELGTGENPNSPTEQPYPHTPPPPER